MRYAILAAALFAHSYAGAQPGSVVLDFEEYRSAYEFNCFGPVVADGGFTFEFEAPADEPYPVGICAATPLWRFHYGTSVAIFANNCRATLTMRAENGKRFRLDSMEVQELNGLPPATITFVGVRSEGQSVTHTHALNGSAAWETVVFPPSFHNVKSVTWQQGAGDCWVNQPHMVANVRAGAIGNAPD